VFSRDQRIFSFSGRILANFFNPIFKPEQQVEDSLSELGKIATTPEANIIKLQISQAILPQLKAAIKDNNIRLCDS